jgi:hypothetical protein
MRKTLAVSILIVTLFAAYLYAEDRTPEEYIIQKGDTLWDISDFKLEDNFLWPRLWNVNPQIENPDLIYPGTKIWIPSREELMRMFTAPKKKTPVLRKKRHIRSALKFPETKQKKYILDRDLYVSSGWISPRFPGVGEIIHSQIEHQIIGEADIVYLKFDESRAEKDFLVIRDVKVVRHPVTRKKIGHQIRVAGILEIVGMDNNVPKAIITTSYEDIHIGDALLPFEAMALEPPFVPDEISTPDINGYIIESYLNHLSSGEGDIIFLDKGREDGLEVGDIVHVLSDVPVKRPVGKIQIISLQPSTSAAFVLESRREISLGAKWGNM